MMPNLAAIYDDAFFAEWGRDNEAYIRGAEIITGLLHDLFRPKSLVDLGCGCGVYTDAFRRRGVEVLPIDGARVPAAHGFPIDPVVRDLTVPFENEWGPFDAVLCLEVAEHIPAEFLEPFLRNAIQFSDTLILSAAPPNQGGHHHVNEQPKRYWVRALAERGFAYNRRKTGRFIENFKLTAAPFKWMGEHVSVYERVAETEGKRPEGAFGVRVSG